MLDISFLIFLNYFDDPIELLSDLYLAKFLDSLVQKKVRKDTYSLLTLPKF